MIDSSMVWFPKSVRRTEASDAEPLGTVDLIRKKETDHMQNREAEGPVHHILPSSKRDNFVYAQRFVFKRLSAYYNTLRRKGSKRDSASTTKDKRYALASLAERNLKNPHVSFPRSIMLWVYNSYKSRQFLLPA